MKAIQQYAVLYDPPTILVEYRIGYSNYVKRIRIKKATLQKKSPVGKSTLSIHRKNLKFIYSCQAFIAQRLVSHFKDTFGDDDHQFEQVLFE